MGKSKLPAVVATAVAVPAAVAAGVVVFNLIEPAAEDSRFDEDLVLVLIFGLYCMVRRVRDASG